MAIIMKKLVSFLTLLFVLTLSGGYLVLHAQVSDEILSYLPAIFIEESAWEATPTPTDEPTYHPHLGKPVPTRSRCQSCLANSQLDNPKIRR